jgi:hypothetical protein
MNGYKEYLRIAAGKLGGVNNVGEFALAKGKSV